MSEVINLEVNKTRRRPNPICPIICPITLLVSIQAAQLLDMVKFANDWAFEMLISGCPVLESLTIRRSHDDNVKVLRVCSQSLLSFSQSGPDVDPDLFEEELVVAIDAPRLETLKLYDQETNRIVINNLCSLAKVEMNIVFSKIPGEQPLSISPGLHCFLPTLESVEIIKLMIDDAAEMELVSYFLENSTILKKLTLFLNPSRKKEASVILRRFLTIPRLSTSCQVVVSDSHSLWGLG